MYNTLVVRALLAGQQLFTAPEKQVNWQNHEEKRRSSKFYQHTTIVPLVAPSLQIKGIGEA